MIIIQLQNIGLFISHEKIVKNFDNYTNNSLEAQQVFASDFTRYDSNFLNNWVMYVYEIQHHESENLALNKEFNYFPPWNGQIVSGINIPDINIEESEVNVFQKLPLSGTMRINIRALYGDPNDTDSIKSVLLLPTEDNILNNIDTSFNIPVSENNSNLNFFGSKINPQATINNIDGWQLWNGSARNMLIVNKLLTLNQLRNLFKRGISEYYDWEEFGARRIIKQINKNSYLGSLYVYNTNNLNINGNRFIQNIKTLESINFS